MIENMAKKKFDRSKLAGRIVEKYGSRCKFAEVCGITKASMTKKLQGTMGITFSDIVNWSELLEIPYKDIPKYFFVKKVK